MFTTENLKNKILNSQVLTSLRFMCWMLDLIASLTEAWLRPSMYWQYSALQRTAHYSWNLNKFTGKGQSFFGRMLIKYHIAFTLWEWCPGPNTTSVWVTGRTKHWTATVCYSNSGMHKCAVCCSDWHLHLFRNKTVESTQSPLRNLLKKASTLLVVMDHLRRKAVKSS